MLYILEHTDQLGNDFVEAALPYLSLQRLQIVDQRRFLLDKVNSVAVFLLLRQALKQEYGITKAPDFVPGRNGKPYLKEFGNVYFNFSHCRNACACIVSNRETAVDITDRRKISPSTAAHFCSEQELLLANQAEDPQVAFIRLWCRKECCSKLDGAGLSADFKRLDPTKEPALHTIETPDYVLSYMVDEALSPVLCSVEDVLRL